MSQPVKETAGSVENSKLERPIVQVDNVWKRFGDRAVLQGIDLEIFTGTVTCLAGPSGSGKTTLLRCMNYLERIDSGGIYVKGELVGVERVGTKVRQLGQQRLCEQRRRTGMVFQHFNLFPHMTVMQNLTFAPRHAKMGTRKEIEEKALHWLEQVGLGDRHTSYPEELSGGQQQRVAIARALVMDPDVLLFDEPTSALDPELKVEVLRVMRQLARSGRTMIVATHELNFAMEECDLFVFMENGVVVEMGEPQQVLKQPKNARTKQFLSKVG